MTDIDALIERLTDKSVQDRAAEWDGDAILCEQAAAALREQRTEIARLLVTQRSFGTLQHELMSRAESAEAERKQMIAVIEAADAWFGVTDSGVDELEAEANYRGAREKLERL